MAASADGDPDHGDDRVPSTLDAEKQEEAAEEPHSNMHECTPRHRSADGALAFFFDWWGFL